MDHEHFARMAAPMLEDVGIINLQHYIGTSVKEFGSWIQEEILTANETPSFRDPYQALALELHRHSSVGSNPDYLIRCLCRVACNQWLLKRSLSRHLPTTPSESSMGTSTPEEDTSSSSSTSKTASSTKKVASVSG